MDRELKNLQIRETLKATRERHSKMDVKTFEIKVLGSNLSSEQKAQVNQYFKEAKWLRNHYLSDLENVDWKSNTVNVKIKDNVETRTLTILGSHLKQNILRNPLYSK